jgi:uncharacterized RDD family membrane protein YckC
VKHRVITPENLELTFELAGLTSRFVAWLIDTLFMMAAIIAGLIALAIVGVASPYLFTALMIVFVFVVQQGYFIFFELKTGGTTPGKRMMKIRVIQDAGIRIGFYHSFLRNILRLMDSTPLMVLHVVGAAVAFFHPLNRRLGDAVAGTIVVRERSYPEPGRIIAESDRYSTLMGDYRLREAMKRVVSSEEKEAMIEACLRADEIELSRRLEIFARLGRRMRSKLDLPPMEFSSDEKLVRNITAILLGAEPESSKKA